MAKRLTDEQLLARDEAKVAKRRAKILAAHARASSADYRKVEHAMRALKNLPTEWLGEEDAGRVLATQEALEAVKWRMVKE